MTEIDEFTSCLMVFLKKGRSFNLLTIKPLESILELLGPNLVTTEACKTVIILRSHGKKEN